MKPTVIYDSVTGNTKLLAQEIETFIQEEKLEEKNLVFIGSWTDKGSPSTKIQEVLKTLKNKKIFYFGTCGFGGSEEYFKALFERVKPYIHSSNTILGYFYCQGKMPPSIKERYEKLKKEQPEEKRWEMSLKNYETALEHPNQTDLSNLRKMLQKIFKSEK